MKDAKKLYADHYEGYRGLTGTPDTKYEWAADFIFNLTTYDGELDKLFVKDILEVCEVILNRKNFEYIKSHECYVKYILVCQILDRFHWIDWGTSIRGAWIDDVSRPTVECKDILDKYEWWAYNDKEDPHHVIEKVPFTEENLRALIEFMREGESDAIVSVKDERIKHACWEKVCDRNLWWYACSNCSGGIPKDRYGHDCFSRYCPSCGAEMSLEPSEEESEQCADAIY